MTRKILVALRLSNYQFLEELTHEELPYDLLIIAPKKDIQNLTSKSIFWIYLEKELPIGRIEKLVYHFAIQNKYEYVTVIAETIWTFFCKKSDQFIDKLEVQPDFLILNDSKQSYFGIIKFLQKKLLKTYVSSFNSSITIYSCQFLEHIPFHYNSDTNGFRLELLIQTFLKEAVFQEVHFDSFKKHFSIKKKWQSLGLLFKVFFHNLGIFYQKKFDLVVKNEHYSLKLGYPSSHSYAINGVRAKSKVVDLGAGPFGISQELIRKDCEIVTIDQFDIPSEYKFGVHIVTDLNENFDIPLQKYDYILFLDIIEHLVDPEKFLFQVSKQYTYKPQKLILTTGNIAFFPLRIMLLLGFFNYGKSGILDKTHTRLFTFYSFKKLIQDSQLKITKVKGIPAPYPKAIGKNFVSMSLLWLNMLLIKLSKAVFSYQIYIEAETMPSIQFLNSQITDKNS